jgi:hypothetical protein
VTPASTREREREGWWQRWDRPATLHNDVDPQCIVKIARDLFLLREVFDYGYDEIGTVVGKSEETAVRSPSAPVVRSRQRDRVSRPRGSDERSAPADSSRW